MKRSEIIFGLLRIPVDFTMVVLGFLLGYLLRLKGDYIPGVQFELDASNLPPANEYFELSVIFAILLFIVFTVFGLYKLKNTEGPLFELKRVFSFSIIWVLVVMAYFFLTREVFFSRLALIYSALISVLLIVIARLTLHLLKRIILKADIGRRRILIIGSNKISQNLTEILLKDPRYKIVGYLSEKRSEIKYLKKLGSFKDINKIISDHKIEEIIQTDQSLSEMQDHDILELCHEYHIEYRFVPDILSVERSNIEIEPIAGFPLIHLKPTPLDGWGKVYKRAADIVSSGILLIILSPILLLISIGIKIDSKGPILFKKLEDGTPAYRIGHKGQKFQFYKFRTMKHNTHSQRYGELANKNSRSGPLVKIKNDPRITNFGRLLRKTSLDELPQLWNVIKGDMSLVGPRPHLPEEVAKYKKHHKFLLTIKPGITGLSQISGRSDLDFEEEVRLDSYYIKHWTPLLDLKILLKTFIVVLSGKSAD